MADRLRVISSHLDRDFSLSLRKANETKFKYTLENSTFTEDQRKQYEENGFIIFHKLIPDEILDRCSDRFVEVCEGLVTMGVMTLDKVPESASTQKAELPPHQVCNSIRDIVWDEVFSTYVLNPKILDIVENITGPNIMAMRSMLINKLPDAGTFTSRQPLHQDLHNFHLRPASRIAAVWTAMDSLKRDSGCLVAVPGSHCRSLLEHTSQGGMDKVRGFDDHEVFPIEMDKGDTLVYHPCLVYGSGPNLSQVTKRAISCHYAASECHYLNEATSSPQQDVVGKILGIVNRRGLVTDLEDTGRFRNRLARGKMINL